MFDCRSLEFMNQTDIKAIDKNELVNIQTVMIDTELSAPVRMLHYLEQIKNPYCFLCEGVPVKVRFAPDGDELRELLKRHFIALKQAEARWRGSEGR